MNYSKDLLKKKGKSKYSIALGIFFFAIAIAWIPIQLIEEESSISAFDWIYMVIILLNGLSTTMTGLGYSIDRLVGKAFVEINSQRIRIKKDVLDKEQSVSWDNINSIEYNPNKFIITKPDNTKVKLSISKIEYSVIQEIKNVISEIANKKKITINTN